MNEELGRWLAKLLAKEVASSGQGSLTGSFFDWIDDPSSIRSWSTKRLAGLGINLAAQYIVRAGLLQADSQEINGQMRTRLRLYADLISVESTGETRIEVAAVGYAFGDELNWRMRWPEIDVSSSAFAASSIYQALRNGIDQLSTVIAQEVLSTSSSFTHQQVQRPAEVIPIEQARVARKSAASEEPALEEAGAEDQNESIANEELQQLLSQVRECLNNVNASREKLEALIQAVQTLTSTLEKKASFLEEGRFAETERADAQIHAESQELQQVVDEILPDDANLLAANEASAEYTESSGDGSWFDRVTIAVDFGFSVVDRILDIRDRLRSFREEPFHDASVSAQGGQQEGAGDLPVEDPFVDLDGNIFQDNDATQGTGRDEQPRASYAVLRVDSKQAGGRWTLVPSDTTGPEAIAYASAVIGRRRPVAGAEVLEPASGASTRSDSNGYYSLRIPTRSKRLVVRIGGRQVGERRLDLVGLRQTTADVRINPLTGVGAAPSGTVLPSRVVVSRDGSGTGAITGLVRDAQGQPVRRALVEISKLASARTDSLGKFVFIKVPAGSQILAVRAANIQPHSEQIRIRANEAVQKTINLGSRIQASVPGERLIAPGAGTVFKGTVIDQQNRPLSGARVSVIGSSTSLSLHTDAHGNFEFKDLKSGSYRAQVSKIGYTDLARSISLRNQSKQARFQMEQTDAPAAMRKWIDAMGEVRGLVREANGRPIALATLELTANDRKNGNYRATSNSKGEFVFKAIQGRYRLSAQRPGFNERTQTVEIRARESTRFNLELNPTALRSDGRLIGRIVDERGKPISNAKVTVNGQSDTSDSSGNYEIGNLETGGQEVRIMCSGYGLLADTVNIRGAGVTNKNFELRSISGFGGGTLEGTIRGRVTDDQTGKGLSGVRVSILNRGDITDSNGNYQINNLPAGRQQIVVARVGYVEERTTVEIKSGPSSKNFDLRPIRVSDGGGGRPGTGVVRGRVTGDNGARPISSARVSVGGRSDSTDHAGTYEIHGVPAGKHSVRVSRSGYSDDSSTVEVRAGSTATKNFRLRSSRTPMYPGRTPPMFPERRPDRRNNSGGVSDRTPSRTPQADSGRVSGRTPSRTPKRSTGRSPNSPN